MNINVELNENKIMVVVEYDEMKMSYINHEKIELIDIKELIKTHSEIVKICKENKIKLSYKNKIKARLSEIKKDSSYLENYSQYNEKFNSLLDLWINKINLMKDNDVIECDFYKNVIQPEKREFESLFNYNSTMEFVKESQYKLNSILEELQYSPESYLSITL